MYPVVGFHWLCRLLLLRRPFAALRHRELSQGAASHRRITTSWRNGDSSHHPSLLLARNGDKRRSRRRFLPLEPEPLPRYALGTDIRISWASPCPNRSPRA